MVGLPFIPPATPKAPPAPVLKIPDPADPEFWEKLEAYQRDAAWRRNLRLGQWARRERERIADQAAEVMASLDFSFRQRTLF